MTCISKDAPNCYNNGLITNVMTSKGVLEELKFSCELYVFIWVDRIQLNICKIGVRACNQPRCMLEDSVGCTEMTWVQSDSNSDQPITYIVLPSGKLLGKLATARVDWLSLQYHNIQQRNPAIFTQEQATYLAADIN